MKMSNYKIRIIKNSSILVKNKYNRYEHRIKPKYPLYLKLYRINHNNWNKKTLKEDHSLKIIKIKVLVD